VLATEIDRHIESREREKKRGKKEKEIDRHIESRENEKEREREKERYREGVK
jgi:hypothetical protein